MSKLRRLRQVAIYGWKHAGQISNEHFSGKKRYRIFFDIFRCYNRYGMWRSFSPGTGVT